MLAAPYVRQRERRDAVARLADRRGAERIRAADGAAERHRAGASAVLTNVRL